MAAKCDSERVLTFLAETIFEETGSGVEADSHPTLFRNFLGAIGVAEDAIPGCPTTRAGGEFHELAWKTAREGTFLEGLALVGLAIERPLPAFFQMIARAFQRHHGVDEEAVRFFAVHTVADVKHAQLASRIIGELARTPEEQASVRRVLLGVWDLQQRQLDELHALVRPRLVA